MMSLITCPKEGLVGGLSFDSSHLQIPLTLEPLESIQLVVTWQLIKLNGDVIHCYELHTSQNIKSSVSASLPFPEYQLHP